jgi:hypothetical protein
VKAVRWAAALLATLALAGGYAYQQYSSLSGQLAEYESWVAAPNLVLGWLLLALAIGLSLIGDEEQGAEQ